MLFLHANLLMYAVFRRKKTKVKKKKQSQRKEKTKINFLFQLIRKQKLCIFFFKEPEERIFFFSKPKKTKMKNHEQNLYCFVFYCIFRISRPPKYSCTSIIFIIIFFIVIFITVKNATSKQVSLLNIK